MWNTLGMTGGWNLTKSKYSHCEFILGNGESIWFNDMRNFGTMKFCNSDYDFKKKINSLGPDVLESEFTLDVFISIMTQVKNRDKTIPEIFMNQKYLSGIG